jgi:actin-related protein
VVFPTLIGRPKSGSIGLNEIYFGDEAALKRDVLAMTSPVKNSIVTNWDDFQKVLEYTFSALKVNVQECNVLITDIFWNSQSNREKLCQMLFEKFGVAGMYLANDAVLSLYPSEKSTAIVINITNDFTDVVPICEGSSIPHAMRRIDIEKENLVSSERIRALETLFEPILTKSIVSVISNCDPKIRQTLYKNIVLVGEGSMFEGLPERLEKEVRSLAPSGVTVKVVAPPQRKDFAWIGGSMLASLTTFEAMWLTKEE